MPSQYLILRPAAGGGAEVVFYDSDKQTRTVMFSGGRWAARHYLLDLRGGIGWENVPAFCEKKARRGHPPSLVEMKDAKL